MKAQADVCLCLQSLLLLCIQSEYTLRDPLLFKFGLINEQFVLY